MKNKRRWVITIVILSIIAMALSACDLEEINHSHDWSDWTVTTSASCITAGIETRICAGNASHTEIRFVPVDPDAHVWGNWVVTIPVTATTDGLETGTCMHNSSHTETRIIIALNHTCSWGWGGGWFRTTSPTCVSTGVETRMCSHNSSHRETRSVPIDPDAHVWGNWAVSIPLTETTDGLEARTCIYHSSQSETRIIQHAAHNWGEWVVTQVPTETVDGVETRHCQYSACTFEQTRIFSYATGTAGLEYVFDPSSGFTVIRGTVDSGDVYIPAYHLYAGEYVPITSIGDYAFFGCSSLTSITIPFLDVELGNNLFNYDVPTSLKTVVITGGDNIPNSAFYGCTGLTSITIPNSVTSIGDYAFFGCSSLTSITILAAMPPAIGSHHNLYMQIFVPAGSVDAYKTIWSFYGVNPDIIKAIE